MSYRKHLGVFYRPRYFDRRISIRVAKVKYSVVPCYYCGLPAEHKDHVPALKIMRDMVGAGHYTFFTASTLLLVPACKRCNLTLHARPLLTLAARREYIWKLDSYAAWRCFKVVLAQYRRRMFSSVNILNGPL